ncbi:MAG: transcriptional regulator [Deinococcota bacterium]
MSKLKTKLTAENSTVKLNEVEVGRVYQNKPQQGDVSADIMASWQRSRQVIAPNQTHAPVDDPEEALEEWHDSLLYAAAKPLLQQIRDTAEAGDFLVGIGDAHSKLLWTHSSKQMVRGAEQLHFVPGGHWDEASIGTNALSVAQHTRRPAKVFSAEHFAQVVHDWVCYSAPIRNPHSGDVLGVLDFTTTWQQDNTLGMMTVIALARYVEERLGLLLPVHSEDKRHHQVMQPLLQQRIHQQPFPQQNIHHAEYDMHVDTNVSSQQATYTLRLCGTPQLLLRGEPLALYPRRLEILALLALHPEGLSLDVLHAKLYGDQAVSLSTLRAEISGLRKQLAGGICSRPYRLAESHTVDCLQVRDYLRQGDVANALAGYNGLLMPTSESPYLREWRDYLDTAVRAAVLTSGDSALMWDFTARGFDDLDIMLALLQQLPEQDPRCALLQARLNAFVDDDLYK